MSGMSVSLRSSVTIERIAVSDAPDFRPRCAARWLAGPSAIGSENGTPSSMISAPRNANSRTSAAVASRFGSPATTNGTNAASLCARNSRKVAAIRRFIALISNFRSQRADDRMHILVAASRQIDDHHLVLAHRRRKLHRMSNRMRTLQRRNDSLHLGQQLERVERFRIGNGDILRAPTLIQVRELRPDARIIEARRDRMGLANLPEFILQ